MTINHQGNFDFGYKYGATYILDDGTFVNIMTVWEGDTLAPITEIEALRPLTEHEIDTLLSFDGGVAHGKGPKTEYVPREIQHRFEYEDA